MLMDNAFIASSVEKIKMTTKVLFYPVSSPGHHVFREARVKEIGSPHKIAGVPYEGHGFRPDPLPDPPLVVGGAIIDLAKRRLALEERPRATGNGHPALPLAS